MLATIERVDETISSQSSAQKVAAVRSPIQPAFECNQPLRQSPGKYNQTKIYPSGVGQLNSFMIIPSLSKGSLLKREANFLKTGGHFPFNPSSDDMENLAVEWKSHVNQVLFEAMFPELNRIKSNRQHKLIGALGFWHEVMDFETISSENNVTQRPPCEQYDLRLAAHPVYKLIFHNEDGILDLLFKWCSARLSDSSPRICKATADLLQLSFGRLIAAQKDAQSLMKSNSELDETIRLDLQQEGKITLTETNLLLPHLLERSYQANSEPASAILKDVLLALAFVTPDPSALFHTTLRISRRKPEILELTSFLIEQHGWKLCRDMLNELTDFARLSMSSESQPEIRFLAAQCMAMILLSLPRKDSSEIFKELDAQVPGSRRYISKFVKVNPHLLNIFPEEGISANSEEDLFHLNQGGGLDLNPNCENQAAAGRIIKTEEIVPNESDDFCAQFEGMITAEDIDRSLQSSKDTISKMRLMLRIKNCQLIMQDTMLLLRKEKEGRHISVDYEMRYWNAMRRLEFVQNFPRSMPHESILLETSRLHTNDLILIKESCKNLVCIIEKHSSEENSIGIFASELITASSKAIHTVFKTSPSDPQFPEAAAAVTSLVLLLVKIKKILYPVSPSQLKYLFRCILMAMSSHSIWANVATSDMFVERLNTIMGLHLMALVSPRTA